MDAVTTKTSNAFALAESIHRDQTDRAGAPYMVHLFTVAAYAALATRGDETIMAAALLHDAIEDAAENGFDPRFVASDIAVDVGDDVLRIVEIVTRRDGETYDAFIERIAQDPQATQVKLADLTHNMDLSRLPTVTEADGKRRNKYLRAYRRLTQAEASSPAA